MTIDLLGNIVIVDNEVYEFATVDEAFGFIVALISEGD